MLGVVRGVSVVRGRLESWLQPVVSQWSALDNKHKIIVTILAIQLVLYLVMNKILLATWKYINPASFNTTTYSNGTIANMSACSKVAIYINPEIVADFVPSVAKNDMVGIMLKHLDLNGVTIALAVLGFSMKGSYIERLLVMLLPIGWEYIVKALESGCTSYNYNSTVADPLGITISKQKYPELPVVKPVTVTKSPVTPPIAKLNKEIIESSNVQLSSPKADSQSASISLDANTQSKIETLLKHTLGNKEWQIRTNTRGKLQGYASDNDTNVTQFIIGKLLGALKDSNADVAVRAIDTLVVLFDAHTIYLGQIIEQLLQALQYPDVNVRDYAIYALGHFGPNVSDKKGIIQKLIKVALQDFSVKHDNGFSKYFVPHAHYVKEVFTAEARSVGMGDGLYKLGRFLSQTDRQFAVELLLSLLNTTENGSARYTVVELLGAIGDTQEIVDTLIALVITLPVDAPNTKKKNAFGLRDMVSRNVVTLDYINDKLLAILDNQDEQGRANAADVLGQVNWKNTNTQYILDRLLVQVSDNSATVRAAILTAIGKVSVTTVANLQPIIGKLLDALNDEHSGVRANAASALGGLNKTQIDNPEAIIERLLSAIHDGDKSVRNSAIQALNTLNGIHELLKATDSSSASKKANFVYALGEITAAKNNACRDRSIIENDIQHIVNQLLSAMQDSDSTVRAAAAEALGKYGSTTKFPDTESVVGSLLKAITEESDNTVREQAVKALGMVCTNKSHTVDSSAIEDVLYKVLDSPDKDLQIHAAEALRKCGDKE